MQVDIGRCNSRPEPRSWVTSRIASAKLIFQGVLSSRTPASRVPPSELVLAAPRPCLLPLVPQIGVPLDPNCLYGTVPALSQQGKEQQQATSTAPVAGDVSSSSGSSAGDVDERDLGGFSQLVVVESMLDRGDGLEAGLQGVAMTR